MNILKKIAFKWAIKAAGSYSLQDPEFGKLLTSMLGLRTHTGKPVDARSSMEVSTFWACVRILSETIGSVPLGIFEKDRNTNNLQQVDHVLGQVLAQPNADMDGVAYMEAKVANLAQQGNAFSIADKRNDGSLISLYPVPSLRCAIGVDPNSGEIVYDINDRGRWITYPKDKVWHVKGFGFDGLQGLSPLTYMRNSLAMSLSAEEFQAKFFARGASPSFVISVPQWLTTEQRVIARENLEKLWGGMDNAHSARLLEGGMKPEGGTMPLQQAQFSELRGFSVEEIARAMRIPLHMVGDLSQSTNNNIEQQSLEFVMFALMPYTNRIQSSIQRWLMSPAERLKYVARFNLDSFMRADAAARGTLMQQYVQNGIFSRNEVRAFEGRNRSDAAGMDDYTVINTMVPLSKVLDMVNAQIKKNSMPPPAPVVGGDAGKGTSLTVINEKGETKHHTYNLVQMPDNTIHVAPAAVTVEGSKTEVHPTDIHFPPAPDNSQMAEVLQSMGEMLMEIRTSQKEDIEVRRKILERVDNMEA